MFLLYQLLSIFREYVIDVDIVGGRETPRSVRMILSALSSVCMCLCAFMPTSCTKARGDFWTIQDLETKEDYVSIRDQEKHWESMRMFAELWSAGQENASVEIEEGNAPF